MTGYGKTTLHLILAACLAGVMALGVPTSAEGGVAEAPDDLAYQTVSEHFASNLVPKPIIGARHPAPSPDGSEIAFSYQGDLWAVPALGGDARRLTVHSARDHSPEWSPDGRWIAFSSDRFGHDDVYVMPARGGTPTRLTYNSAGDYVECWTLDGNEVVFSSRREELELVTYAIPMTGGRARHLVQDRSFNVSISPDGSTIAYVRGWTPWWRRHYRGSASRNIWLRPFQASGPDVHRKLTSDRWNTDFPMWSRDARFIYCVSETDSVANIYRVSVEEGTREQITFHSHETIQFPAISRDGSVIAYELGEEIWILRTDTHEAFAIDIYAPTDIGENDLRFATFSNKATEFALSSDEKQLAFVVHGDIFVMSFRDGEGSPPKQVTEGAPRESDLAWSPDGEALLFVSDRYGNPDVFLVRSAQEDEKRLDRARDYEITRLTDDPATEKDPAFSPDSERIGFFRGSDNLMVMDADGTNERLQVEGPQIWWFDWSPDSRWLAYSRNVLGWREDVFIVSPSGEEEPVNITKHPNDDFYPLWTADGKSLSFLSRDGRGNNLLKYVHLEKTEEEKTKEQRLREEEDAGKGEEKTEGDGENNDTEKEEVPRVDIDFDRIHERIRTVGSFRGDYEPHSQSPDGKNFALPSDHLGESDLWTVDWEGETVKRLTSDGSSPTNIRFRKDNETILYLRESKGTIHSVKVDGSKASTISFSAELTISTREERAQMYDEAWRLLNDGFYDGNFHGVDWPAMREKYRRRALETTSRQEFCDVLREIVGELNASHMGIYRWRPPEQATGNLGIVPDPSHDGPGVRILRVVPRTPADRESSKLHAGEYILEIEGKEVTPGEGFYDLLGGTAGEETEIKVAESSGGKNARSVTIIPEGRSAFYRHMYLEWVDERRSMVDSLSEGRVGYIHMAAMGERDLARFEEEIYSRVNDKEALVLDDRDNNGGRVHDEVLTVLARKAYGYSVPRDGSPQYNSLYRWEKPVVLIINERAYSDGEIFPMGFKALGLGTVVGIPTFGAVIGTDDVELMDGTTVRVPQTGWYDLNGRNLENWGIEPDIYVDAPPEEHLTGRDVQLERAVQEALGEIGE